MKTTTISATSKQLEALRKGLNELAHHAYSDTGGAPWSVNELQAIVALAKILTGFDKPPTKAAIKRLQYALAFAEHYDKTYK